MSIQDLFNNMEDSCHPAEAVTFEWSSKGVGFGQAVFYVNKKDGYVHCYNEIMSRTFLKEMLCKMVDNCVLEEPNERHPDGGQFPPGYVPKPITK